MKPFLFNIIGVPKQPLQKTRSARFGYCLHWLFFLAFTFFILLQLVPSIVFQHKMTAHGITVHTRTPVPSAADSVLAQAAALVAASELAVPGQDVDVFVADTPWVFWLFRPFKSSFAVSVPWTGNIFIANGDFEANVARSRHRTFNTRALSAVIAHEITHGLIQRRLGFIESVRVPSWVTEGYCDYVAKEGSYPEREGLELLASGRTDPSSSFQYFVGRQLVTHLIEKEKMSFAQIAAGALESTQLHDRVAAKMMTNNEPKQ